MVFISVNKQMWWVPIPERSLQDTLVISNIDYISLQFYNICHPRFANQHFPGQDFLSAGTSASKIYLCAMIEHINIHMCTPTKAGSPFMHLHCISIVLANRFYTVPVLCLLVCICVCDCFSQVFAFALTFRLVCTCSDSKCKRNINT